MKLDPEETNQDPRGTDSEGTEYLVPRSGCEYPVPRSGFGTHFQNPDLGIRFPDPLPDSLCPSLIHSSRKAWRVSWVIFKSCCWLQRYYEKLLRLLVLLAKRFKLLYVYNWQMKQTPKTSPISNTLFILCILSYTIYWWIMITDKFGICGYHKLGDFRRQTWRNMRRSWTVSPAQLNSCSISFINIYISM